MDSISLTALAEMLGVKAQPEFSQVSVSGASLSHSRIIPGDLFVAAQGARTHGMDFAELAVQAGAVAIVTDRVVEGLTIPQIFVEDPKSQLGSICNAIYGSVKARLWAITGTNGKTSTATYLYRLLALLGEKAAFSGSTGFEPTSLSTSEGLTTPEADVLHRQIRSWQKTGVSEIVLEVSAQALSRLRVDGLRFTVSGFTNLSHDHLDEYGDMLTYQRAKAKLFTRAHSDKAVITTGDQYARSIYDSCQIDKVELVFSEAAKDSSGYTFEVTPEFALFKGGQKIISSEISPGHLMSKNLALALAMLIEGGYGSEDLQLILPRLELAIPGRLQQINRHSPNQPTVFLDYAHTPDAIRSSIAELRQRGYTRVNIVFSASGDRDHSKRPDMARAASGADLVIVTDFHPRSENPDSIRTELSQVLLELDAHFFDVADPAQAVRQAIIKADSETAVLWCGPGHLKYREIGGNKVPFDPELEVRKAFEGRP